MAKRKTFRRGVRSPAFGQWIRNSRYTIRMHQGLLAQKAGLRQQELSRIERLGIIPIDDKALARLCQALNRPVAEAIEAIDGGVIRTQEIDVTRYLDFKRRIINLERRWGHVDIFIIREDPQPWDRAAVKEYVDVLTATENTSFYILFRYPDLAITGSFAHLVRGIMRAMSGDSLCNRLKGFYRHPDHVENRALFVLPCVHPYILAHTGRTVDLWSVAYDEIARWRAMADGFKEPEARQRSIRIVSHNGQSADHMMGWVGLITDRGSTWCPIKV